MSILLQRYRVISQQRSDQSVMEILEGPDGRRVQFFAQSSPEPKAFSRLWTDKGWIPVFHLLTPGVVLQDSISLLFQPTEGILGWDSQTNEDS